MIRGGVQFGTGLTAATAAVVACAVSAQAIEVEDVLGRWGSKDGGYDCRGELGTEIAPVEITREGKALFAGAYAWGCTVATPEKRGALIGGPATCGSEGDDEVQPGYIQLGLTAEGQLLLVDQDSIVMLDKCPVQQ